MNNIKRFDEEISSKSTKPLKHAAWMSVTWDLLSQLSPHQKEVCETTTSTQVAEALQSIEKLRASAGKEGHMPTKKSSVLVAVENIRRYYNVLDVLVSTYPLILAPVWGSIKLILAILQNRLEYFDNIASLLEEVAGCLPRLEKFAEIFAEREHVQKALARVHKSMLKILIAISDNFTEPHVTADVDASSPADGQQNNSLLNRFRKGSAPTKTPFLASFDGRYADMMKEYQIHCRNAEKEVELAHIVAVEEERHRAEEERRRAEEARERTEKELRRDLTRRAFQWLQPAFIDMEAAQERLRKSQAKNTCLWFTERSEFRTFIAATSSKTLWVHGKPGCGKSVLAASTIHYLRRKKPIRYLNSETVFGDDLKPSRLSWHNIEQKDSLLAFTFCGSLPTTQKTSSVVISCLLSQLCTQNEDLRKKLSHRMENSFRPYATKEEVLSMFKEDVGSLNTEIVFLVDGLDELPDPEDRKTLLKAFNQYRHISKSSALKVVIFSRYEVDIVADLRHDLEIRILPEFVDPDIRIVIPKLAGKVIEYHGVQDEIAQEKIRKAFEKSTNGLFLWGELLARHLEYQVNKEDLMLALNDLPRDITNMYRSAFMRLADETPARKNIAMRTLALLASAQRPLDLEELQIALSIKEADIDFRPDRFITRPRKLLMTTCGILLEVQHIHTMGNAYDTYISTVTLAHSTVLEFLMHEASKEVGFGLPLNLEMCHLSAALNCLTYLSFDRFANEPVGRSEWDYHFERGRKTYGYWSIRDPVQHYLRYSVVYVWDHVAGSGRAGANNNGLLSKIRNFVNSRQILTWIQYAHVNNGASSISSFSRNGSPVPTLDEWHFGLGANLKAWIELLETSHEHTTASLLRTWQKDLLDVIRLWAATDFGNPLSIRNVSTFAVPSGSIFRKFQQAEMAENMSRRANQQFEFTPWDPDQPRRKESELRFETESDSDEDNVWAGRRWRKNMKANMNQVHLNP